MHIDVGLGAKSSRTGNNYLSLLMNKPDGDLRINAVQNLEQRRGAGTATGRVTIDSKGGSHGL